MINIVNQFSDFSKEQNFSEKLVNTLAATTFIVVWYAIVFSLYQFFEDNATYTYGQFFLEPYNQWFVMQRRQPSIYEIFFIVSILAPLWEEICFRKAPIDIGQSLNLTKSAMASLVLAMSSLFALGHPLGILSLPVQGVFGMTSAWLYLKNKSIWWSIVFHSSWNGMLLFNVLS